MASILDIAASARQFYCSCSACYGAQYLTVVAEVCRYKKGVAHMCNPFHLFGSACWARTSDPMINSHLLYQLS